jgi:N-acyl-D-amino-acid deacylase
MKSMPVIAYVIGKRGLDREPATAADVARMEALTEEAMQAGALGFATSRTLVHRTGSGNFIPSFDAERTELEALAAAVGRCGRGVVQLVPNLGSPDYRREIDLLIGMGQASGRPVTFSLAQSHENSDVWRETLSRIAEANEQLGTSLVAQVFPRPMGMITGLDTSVNTFSLCPSCAAARRSLLGDNQIFTHASSLDAAVGAKVIAMRPLERTHAGFVASQKVLENFTVRIAVRTVREHDLAMAKQPKQSVKGIERRFA